MHREIVIALSLLSLISGGALIATLRERWPVVRWVAFSLTAFITEYLVASAVFFLFDRFAIERALAAQLAANLVALITRCLWLWIHRERVFGALDWDLGGHWMPLLMAVLALALSGNNFGFWGMGQDEGVYQTQAIDLMSGKSEQIYHFEEYDALETQAQRELFLDGIRTRLIGLYSIETYWPREYALALPSLVNRVATPEADEAEAVYHGIPTFPAVLALFGVLGGSYGHMMDAQTACYALCVLMLWFAAENLKLKKSASTLACLVYLLSPQSLWLSKSALTETLSALIICTFLCLVTQREYRHRRGWSALMVTAFACLHVSIYAMLPMFLGVYVLLFLLSADRRYLLAILWSSLSFLAGFAFMTVASPYYVIQNLGKIVHGPVTRYSAWYVAMGMGVLGALLPLPLLRYTDPGRFRQWLRSRGAGALFRAVVVLLVGWSAVNAVRGAGETDLHSAVVTNGLYVFIWITGIIAIPAATVHLLRHGSRLLGREAVAAVSFTFLYSILLFAACLMPRVNYCYYYSRYLGPYIPVACLMAGIAFSEASAALVCSGILVGAAVLLPFDRTLLLKQDDTFCSFDTVERVLDAVSETDAPVIFSADDFEDFRALYLPVRSTGAACYIQDKANQDEQLRQLARTSDTLFFIGAGDVPPVFSARPVLRIMEQNGGDDNATNRWPYCPLPYDFYTWPSEICVYRCDQQAAFAPWQLATTGALQDGRIVLNAGEVQYGPYLHLEPGGYRVRVEGEGLSASIFYATADAGATPLSTEPLTVEDNAIVYDFTLDAVADNVEFLIYCQENGPVMIDRVVLTDLRLIE